MELELLCDKDCIICYDNKENEWLTLECRHIYHKKCITQWMRIRMTCPICVQTIQPHHIENRERVIEIDDTIRTYCDRNTVTIISGLLCVAIILISIGGIISIYSR